MGQLSKLSYRYIMSAITTGMGQISSAVVRMRRELGERIDALSSKVDGGVEIAKQTQKEMGAMREAGSAGGGGGLERDTLRPETLTNLAWKRRNRPPFVSNTNHQYRC
jgi:hypothetical protein